jgi:hypothetical protein
MTDDNNVQPVPSAQLVRRDAGGLAGALFVLADEIMSGKRIEQARVNAMCKIATTYSGLVRVHIASERHQSTGAGGLVIDHETKSATTNGATE